MEPYRWDVESAEEWMALIALSDCFAGDYIRVATAELPSGWGGACMGRRSRDEAAVVLVDRPKMGADAVATLAHELGHALDHWAGANIEDEHAEEVAWLIARSLAMTARAAVLARKGEERARRRAREKAKRAADDAP
jgi:hypothetical protein